MIYVTFAHAPAMRETGDISGPRSLCQETDWQFVLTSRELFRTVTFDLATAQIRTPLREHLAVRAGRWFVIFCHVRYAGSGLRGPKFVNLLAELFPPCQSP
jgi:hypothetical protein